MKAFEFIFSDAEGNAGNLSTPVAFPWFIAFNILLAEVSLSLVCKKNILCVYMDLVSHYTEGSWFLI